MGSLEIDGGNGADYARTNHTGAALQQWTLI
jgi:hypothetical protein